VAINAGRLKDCKLITNTNNMFDLTDTKKFTSLKIAELTSMPYDVLLEEIREMELAWEKVTGQKFSLHEYTSSKGRKIPVYVFKLTEFLFIYTKYNRDLLMALIDRTLELEEELYGKSVGSGFSIDDMIEEAFNELSQLN